MIVMVMTAMMVMPVMVLQSLIGTSRCCHQTSERVRSINCRGRAAHCATARALLCTCIKSVLVPRIVTHANITEAEEVDRIVRILLHLEQAFDHHLAFVLWQTASPMSKGHYQVPWAAVTLLNNSLRYPVVNPKPVHTGLEFDKVFGS
jgi:hypothetical protein